MAHPLPQFVNGIISSGFRSFTVGVIGGALLPQRVTQRLPSELDVTTSFKFGIILPVFTATMQLLRPLSHMENEHVNEAIAWLTSLAVVQIVHDRLFSTMLVTSTPLRVLIYSAGCVNLIVITVTNLYQAARSSLTEQSFFSRVVFPDLTSLTPKPPNQECTCDIPYTIDVKEPIDINVTLTGYHFLDRRVPSSKNPYDHVWHFRVDKEDQLLEFKGGIEALKKRLLCDLGSRGISIHPDCLHYTSKTTRGKSLPCLDGPIHIESMGPPYVKKRVLDNLKSGSSDSQHVQLVKIQIGEDYWPLLIKYYPLDRNYRLYENDTLITPEARYVVLAPQPLGTEAAEKAIKRFLEKQLKDNKIHVTFSRKAYDEALTPPSLRAVLTDTRSRADASESDSADAQ